ncbi:MAG TPA: ATP-grasp domain-containing protein [Pseudonocardiaceae bacterium]
MSAKGLSGRPLFLVFEPTNHIYQVIEAADRRGFDTVVFHTIPILTAGPYGECSKAIAVSHNVGSWDDQDACLATVLELCAGRTVAGTYAAQEITLELEARVQEHFGLPTKGLRTIRELLDKVTVRRRLADAGLSALRVFDEAQANTLTEWPVGDRALFFKPVHGAGSAYVRRCTTLDEVRACAGRWRSDDKGAIPVLGPYLELGSFFLEEEATGELLSVEGFVVDGEYTALGLTSRTVLARDVSVEMGISYPYEHPRRADIVDFVTRVHAALGITHGATHVEVMVPPGDGPVEVVEVNLRFIGADALATMNAAYGTTLEDDLVALAIGERPRLGLRAERVASLHFLLPPRGLRRLDSFRLAADGLPFVKIIKPPGTELASTDRQIDWIAAYIVCGDTYEESFARAIDIRRRTLVNGEPLGDDPNNVVIGR